MRLIDTSVLIEDVKKGVYEEGAISSITLIEVLCGIAPEKRVMVKELLEKSYELKSLDNEAILKYCVLYDALKEKENLIRDADLLIASVAIAKNLELMTKDKDFERQKDLGLKLKLEK
ncbi:type II toxin-antitoxin system VapC family toxin [Fervidicoccus sp.]|uniref:type II toxin-antitoxin system VapC family toxin n=1 Tax=Fervidicoccus sp. TaxID=2060324 RepID=UPI003D124547